MGRVVFADNLSELVKLAGDSVPLIYIDPPFNTGRTQTRTQIKTVRSENGDRVGFKGQRYQTKRIATHSFADTFDDFLGFLEPRLREAYRVLAVTGTLYLHVNYREVHYCKVLLDEIFGRECFLNEIIWAYDYGARTTRRWPAKHDNILVYVKDPANYVFNTDEVEREPYMAPGLVGPEKAARGKLPSDCYAADTDILTARGWIPVAQLTPSDEVATVAPDGGLRYAPTTALHAYHYDGELCAFTTKTVDILVTPNHQLYVRPKHETEYRFVPAEELLDARETRGAGSYYSLRNQLNWTTPLVATTFCVPPCTYQRADCARPLPEFDLGDWCEFMGWYLSEGGTAIHADRHEVTISQQTTVNLPHIHSLLTNMGLTYRYDGRCFLVGNKQLTLYLRQFGKAHEKYIPRELLQLAQPFLARLYRGLLLGDGSSRRNMQTYHTVSARLADDVQELLLKLGYNANIITPSHPSVRKPSWRTQYIVSRRTSKESTIFPSLHATRQPYQGMVYCCTVEPHHTLVVRRNGKPVVCGNCWWHTIVSPTGKEKTGYPTQKPLGVLKRIIAASSRPGDLVLDFFAGSGTTGEAAAVLGRDFLLIDNNEDAVITMAKRLGHLPGVEFDGMDVTAHLPAAIQPSLLTPGG
jgi:DNA modification methylase